MRSECDDPVGSGISNHSELVSKLFCLVLASAILAACFPEKLVAPPCAATAFTTSAGTADTIVTSTGMKYLETTVGTGGAVEWCRTTTIHYQAYLADGTKFDDTEVTGIPLPFTPGVGNLIDGIEQGVIGMRLNGERRLIIPAALAFGPQGRRDAQGNVIVPPNATVIYDIAVIAVNQ